MAQHKAEGPGLNLTYDFAEAEAAVTGLFTDSPVSLVCIRMIKYKVR